MLMSMQLKKVKTNFAGTHANVGKCARFVTIEVFCGPVLTVVKFYVARKCCNWSVSPSATDSSNHSQ
jgi:hypothetical protein